MTTSPSCRRPFSAVASPSTSAGGLLSLWCSYPAWSFIHATLRANGFTSPSQWAWVSGPLRLLPCRCCGLLFSMPFPPQLYTPLFGHAQPLFPSFPHTTVTWLASSTVVFCRSPRLSWPGLRRHSVLTPAPGADCCRTFLTPVVVPLLGRLRTALKSFLHSLLLLDPSRLLASLCQFASLPLPPPLYFFSPCPILLHACVPLGVFLVPCRALACFRVAAWLLPLPNGLPPVPSALVAIRYRSNPRRHHSNSWPPRFSF